MGKILKGKFRIELEEKAIELTEIDKFGVKIKWKVANHDDIYLLFYLKGNTSCTIIFPLHREI